MSTHNNNVVPEAREGLNKFKNEVADDLGIELKEHTGDINARDAGKKGGAIGGAMVSRMIKAYEKENLR